MFTKLTTKLDYTITSSELDDYWIPKKILVICFYLPNTTVFYQECVSKQLFNFFQTVEELYALADKIIGTKNL